jgi:hypothetical protein
MHSTALRTTTNPRIIEAGYGSRAVGRQADERLTERPGARNLFAKRYPGGSFGPAFYILYWC